VCCAVLRCLSPPPAGQQQAEAEARQETVAATLADKKKALEGAKKELTKAQQEGRHVESQVCCGGTAGGQLGWSTSMVFISSINSWLGACLHGCNGFFSLSQP
jgi:hypothetical protein